MIRRTWTFYDLEMCMCSDKSLLCCSMTVKTTVREQLAFCIAVKILLGGTQHPGVECMSSNPGSIPDFSFLLMF